MNFILTCFSEGIKTGAPRAHDVPTQSAMMSPPTNVEFSATLHAPFLIRVSLPWNYVLLTA